jgi:molybdopterin-guanine dinucleotide biosynthesis protein A
MTADARPLYGLVLAGGRSRRMGRDKALLEHDGETQLGRAMRALASVTDRQFVSTRADQADDPERARYAQVVDRYDDLGPVAGILSAMDEYGEADWLVVACDLPNLDEATLAHLVANRAPGEPFTAFRSSHDGLPEPLCAIYAAGSREIVRRFVDDGIICPRKMLIRAEAALLSQPDPRALDNINTPDDLAGSILEG